MYEIALCHLLSWPLHTTRPYASEEAADSSGLATSQHHPGEAHGCLVPPKVISPERQSPTRLSAQHAHPPSLCPQPHFIPLYVHMAPAVFLYSSPALIPLIFYSEIIFVFTSLKCLSSKQAVNFIPIRTNSAVFFLQYYIPWTEHKIWTEKVIDSIYK